jgi:RNA polymerase sigma factor (sigma-70 family)
MPRPILSAAIARASRSVAPPSEAKATEGRLLTQFIQTKDELAFAELVRRIGPMILGVCRRITADRHLAEDAFQATFLVLTRRAGVVQPREDVRGWLYGVAVRIAREARRVSARRSAHEQLVPTVPDRMSYPHNPLDADTLQILDLEVAALPAHLRDAVVLCELGGLSRKVAAERLRIPEGTLSSRLGKARKLLAERLSDRGVTLPATGLLALGLTSVAVPSRLMAQTSALISPSVSLPPTVAALVNGVMRTMLLQKLKLKMTLASALVLVAALVAARTAGSEVSAQEPQRSVAVLAPFAVKTTIAANTQGENKPQAKQGETGTLLLTRGGSCWVLTPEGKKSSDIALPEKTFSLGQASFSPDSSQVAFIVRDEEALFLKPENKDKQYPLKVVIRDVKKPMVGKEWEVPQLHSIVCWAMGGKKFVVTKQTDNSPLTFESSLLDPLTGKTEKLDLPPNARLLDIGKDEKTFLIEVYDPKTNTQSLGLAVKGEVKVQELTTLQGQSRGTTARLSPDGKKVLFTDADPKRKLAYKWAEGLSMCPYLLDVATKKREQLADFPEFAFATGIAWSPDGKRVAYTWHQLHEELLKKDSNNIEETMIDTEGFLVISDPDGMHPKTILSDKIGNATNLIFGSVDWR